MTRPSETFIDSVALVGRIAIAVLFAFSGIGKILSPLPTIAFIASAGLPLAPLGLFIAIAVEIGGSALLALGLFTRTTALVLIGFSLATAVFFHLNISDQGQAAHFFKNIAIVGGLLQIVAFGPGRYSIDARRNSVISLA